MTVLLLALFGNVTSCWAACSSQLPCDKCASSSEFSWNPKNQDTTARLQHFYDLGDQLEVAYQRGEFDKAQQLANENLDLAAVYRCNWNYGNAIHDSNQVLGLISLKSNDVDAASEYLRQAGESSGSPTLDTFGPELDLADALLQRGKRGVVTSYLLSIKRFWHDDEGNIDRWVAQIDKGETPKLERFAMAPPGLGANLLTGLATLWPAIVSAGFLILRRSQLTRKRLFFGMSTAIGYLAMFGCSLMLGFFGTSMFVTFAELGLPAAVSVGGPIVLVLLLPVATTVVVARYFRARPPVIVSAA